MHNIKVIFAILTAATVAVHGQSLDNDDVPPECRDICMPVIQLEQQCDNRHDDDNDNNNDDNDDNNNNNPPGPNNNQQYRDCVCQGPNAAQALQTCQQCTAQYPNYFIDDDDNDQDENEIERWLQICGVQAGGGPMTSMSTGAAMPTQTGIQSMTTSLVTYPCTDDDNDGDDDDDDNDDLDTCTSTVIGPVGGGVVPPPGMTPSPTSAPTTMVTGSMTTVTQTFACTDDDNDGDDDDNDDDDRDTCTRTTVVPVGATVDTIRPTGTQATGTGATQYTGAAAMATVMPYVGAGALFMLAGFAM